VGLFQMLRGTGADTLIIDTALSPDHPEAQWHSRTVALLTEPVDNVMNAASELFPGSGKAIVSHPSRAAVLSNLSSFSPKSTGDRSLRHGEPMASAITRKTNAQPSSYTALDRSRAVPTYSIQRTEWFSCALLFSCTIRANLCNS
jgi:hypothetical protein